MFHCEDHGMSIYESTKLIKFKETDKFTPIDYIYFQQSTAEILNKESKKEAAHNVIMGSRVANEVYWQAKFEVFLKDADIAFHQQEFRPDLAISALKQHRLAPGKTPLDPQLAGIDVPALCSGGAFEVRYAIDIDKLSGDSISETELADALENTAQQFNTTSNIKIKLIQQPSNSDAGSVDLFISATPSPHEQWHSTDSIAAFTDRFGKYKLSQLFAGAIPITQGLNTSTINPKKTPKKDAKTGEVQDEDYKSAVIPLKRSVIEMMLKRWISRSPTAYRAIDTDYTPKEKITTKLCVMSVRRFEAYTFRDNKKHKKGANVFGAFYAAEVLEKTMKFGEIATFFVPSTKDEDTNTLDRLTGTLAGQVNNPSLMSSPVFARIFDWAQTALKPTESTLSPYACLDKSLVLFEHDGDTLIRVWGLEHGAESLSPRLKDHVDLTLTFPELCEQWFLENRFSRSKSPTSSSLVNESICGRHDPEYAVEFHGPRVFIHRKLNSPQSRVKRVLMTVFCLLYSKDDPECKATEENAGYVLAGNTSDELGLTGFSGVKQTIYEKVAKLVTSD